MLELAGLVSTENVGGESNIQALQCGVFYTEKWQFKTENLHGKSLMPLVRGETSWLRDIAVCSSTLIHHSPAVAKCAVATEDGWCLHYAGSYAQEAAGNGPAGAALIDAAALQNPIEPALFCISEDPDEEHDVIGNNEALARDIHARYVSFLEEIGTPEAHLAGRRRLR
jgi:hypothetical protein